LGTGSPVRRPAASGRHPIPPHLKGKRDRAILAILLGCGLRRRELADLDFTHLQQREEHWAIVDLVGKGGHIRTVPVPECVKAIVDAWIYAAELRAGKLFRCVWDTRISLADLVN
jgi:site-specific recombinase XerC